LLTNADRDVDEERTVTTTIPNAVPEPSDELLTLPDVAARLLVPMNTLRWWRQKATGPGFFKVGRRLVTTVGDLQAWIEEQKQGHGPHAA
jgi:hypothetical protein